MKSPVSMCGVKIALCLPRRRSAIPVASRPSTLSEASTTYQARVMSRGRAEKVFIGESCRSRPGERRGRLNSAKSMIVLFLWRGRQSAVRTYLWQRRVARGEAVPRRSWCSATQPKKRRGRVDRAEDSTIGGEWRNASAVPKEEDG